MSAPGLWALLTSEQRAKALAYDGPENHGPMSAPGTLDLAVIRARADENPRAAVVLRISRNLFAAGVDPQWYADKLSELALSVTEEAGFSSPTTIALVDEVERQIEAYERLDMAHAQLTGMHTAAKARAEAAEAEAAKLRARVAELEGADERRPFRGVFTPKALNVPPGSPPPPRPEDE